MRSGVGGVGCEEVGGVGCEEWGWEEWVGGVGGRSGVGG